MLGTMNSIQTAEVQPGSVVIVRDALGSTHRMVAVTGVEMKGHSFPTVWVKPLVGGDRMPWPADAVKPE